jgi:hypothetical protein
MKRLDGQAAKSKFKDLTGMRFGKLITLYMLPRALGERRACLCRCDCGVEKKVKSHNLTSGKTESCGCVKLEASKTNIKVAHVNNVRLGSAFRKVLTQYKSAAKSRGLCWALTDDQFKTLTSSPCYYTGAFPSTIMEAGSGEIYVYNGIDRVNNEKGYTTDNCVACCGEVNMMKKAMTKEHFIEVCSRISERFKLCHLQRLA